MTDKAKKLIQAFMSLTTLIEYEDICYMDECRSSEDGLILIGNDTVHTYSSKQLDEAEVRGNEVTLFDGETYKTYSLYQTTEYDVEAVLKYPVKTIIDNLDKSNPSNI